MPEKLAPTRRSIRPVAGDTFETVAARELPDLPAEEAVSSLHDWNPHLTRFALAPRALLVSDIIYVERSPHGPEGNMLRG